MQYNFKIIQKMQKSEYQVNESHAQAGLKKNGEASERERQLRKQLKVEAMRQNRKNDTAAIFVWNDAEPVESRICLLDVQLNPMDNVRVLKSKVQEKLREKGGYLRDFDLIFRDRVLTEGPPLTNQGVGAWSDLHIKKLG